MDALFPKRCIQCNSVLSGTESALCYLCLDEIPESVYTKQSRHLATQIFGGRVKIDQAYILSTFQSQSSLQAALHHLKYHGNYRIGEELGRRLATQLSQKPPKLDALIPVPIHPKKKAKRGYNQSFHIAKGIGSVLSIPVLNALCRLEHTPSQTTLSRSNRWENVAHAFGLNPDVEELNTQLHVGLVDDTLTTGATLEACAHILQEASFQHISILCLGYAHK